jgi:hypothetical protein
MAGALTLPGWAAARQRALQGLQLARMQLHLEAWHACSCVEAWHACSLHLRGTDAIVLGPPM